MTSKDTTLLPDDPGVFEVIRRMNDTEWAGKKQAFSPAEELAIILLRPFLQTIGGRMMQIMQAGIKSETNNGK